MRKTIFHEPWWLDIVSPEGWQELKVEAGGHLAGFLRFAPHSTKLFKVCRPPPMTRVSAPVVYVEGHKSETRQRRLFHVASDLLAQLPHFDLTRFGLEATTTDALPFMTQGYRIMVQFTFLIDCHRPVEDLWADMRDKTRNLIRRAQERLTVEVIDNVDLFVEEYRRNLGNEPCYIELPLVTPLFEASFSRGQARLTRAMDANGACHAMVMTLWDDHNYYYYLSTRDRNVADTGAVSLLIWDAMQDAQRRSLTFDLDGVTSAGRLQFLYGFGGRVASRFICERSSLGFDLTAKLEGFSRRVMGNRVSSFQR